MYLLDMNLPKEAARYPVATPELIIINVNIYSTFILKLLFNRKASNIWMVHTKCVVNFEIIKANQSMR